MRADGLSGGFGSVVLEVDFFRLHAGEKARLTQQELWLVKDIHYSPKSPILLVRLMEGI